MPRAKSLPPDERRSAIMAATEPLVEEFGRDVTTRQIAEAAGVAEGTIFRVFPSKEALLDAVIEEALDPAPTCAAMAGFDRTAALEDRLIFAVELLQARMSRVVALFHALRTRPRPPSEDEQRRRQADDRQINRALTDLMWPGTDDLRLPPDEAATLLRSLTFAVSHPMLNAHHGQADLKPREIVEIFLYGVTAPADAKRTTSC